MFKTALDPCGPIYVTIGDGGNQEGLYREWFDYTPDWSAFRLDAYGHGRLTVHNASHASFGWYQHEGEEAALRDSYWLVKAEACEGKKFIRKRQSVLLTT